MARNPYVSDQGMEEAMQRLGGLRPGAPTIMQHIDALGVALKGTTLGARAHLLSAIVEMVPAVTAATGGDAEDALKLAFTLGVQLGREVS